MTSIIKDSGWPGHPQWEIEPGDSGLIFLIRHHDPKARFHTIDEYMPPPNYETRQRIRDVRDPTRVSKDKDLYVNFSSDAAEAKVRAEVIEGRHLFWDRARQAAEHKASTERMFTKAGWRKDERGDWHDPSREPPPKPIKPATGSLLPQMPLPAHVRRSTQAT